MEKLPKIITDIYEGNKLTVESFTKMKDSIVVSVVDKSRPGYQAIDCWTINSFSKDWYQRGQIIASFPPSKVIAEIL